MDARLRVNTLWIRHRGSTKLVHYLRQSVKIKLVFSPNRISDFNLLFCKTYLTREVRMRFSKPIYICDRLHFIGLMFKSNSKVIIRLTHFMKSITVSLPWIRRICIFCDTYFIRVSVIVNT